MFVDANDDNQLSMDELQRAEQIVADQDKHLRMPPTNGSISNQTQGNRRAFRPVRYSHPESARAKTASTRGNTDPCGTRVIRHGEIVVNHEDARTHRAGRALAPHGLPILLPI